MLQRNITKNITKEPPSYQSKPIISTKLKTFKLSDGITEYFGIIKN